MSLAKLLRGRRAIALALVLPLASWPVAAAQAAPPGSKRKDLMDQLGLPKKKPEPPKPKDDEPEVDEPDYDEPGVDAPEVDEPEADDSSKPDAASKRRITYRGTVRKLLDSGCKSCHATGASAGKTRFSISGDLKADYASAKRLVNTRKPESSLLLSKAAGKAHGGGASFPAGSSKYSTVLEWIEGGALQGGGGAAPAPQQPKPEAEQPAPKSSETKPKPGSAKQTGGASPKPTIEAAPTPEPTPEASWVEPGVELPASGAADYEAPIAYAPSVHAILQARCGSCHDQSAFAGGGALGLSGDPARDYETVVALVDVQNPEASPLLAQARGEAHSGGAVLDAPDPDYAEVLAWIESGAYGPTAADLPAPTGPAAAGESTDEVDATTSASPTAKGPGARLGDGTPVPETTPSRLPFSLPYHLRLNGQFDLSYERREYKDQPFGPGRNALQTYHHFLFLSRSGADDPFGFNIEVLTQQFFEFNARFTTKNKRAKFLIKAGKILVPFGDEPLYHSSYGGKTGFDQALLPVIWSQPGIAVNAHITAGPVSITNDAYAIQGFALRAPDGVLNLQGDYSSFDDFQFGVGDRIGVSWAPLTAWYSVQVNPLGHDRLLFMQAFDLEFWRLDSVPVLQDLVFGLGAVRADVSGGGPGEDYYHFGSYGKLRYYPIDWLYVQYRWGLLTHDNRRGVYFDDTRVNELDNSSHNLSVGGTWKGFYAVLQMFWNLEKANEQDNDFLRFTVGYAF